MLSMLVGREYASPGRDSSRPRPPHIEGRMDCYCGQESHLMLESPLVVLVPFSMALITIIWEVRHHRELSFS